MTERNWKKSVIRITGQLIQTFPLSVLTKRFFQNRTNIIYYHGVWSTPEKQNLFGGISLENLETHLDQLEQFFKFEPLNHIIGTTSSNPTSYLPGLAITFDDGFDLISTGAIDVLEARGISATMFVNTALPDNKCLMWQHMIHVIRKSKGHKRVLSELNKLQNSLGFDCISDLEGQTKHTKYWPMELKEEYAEWLWYRCKMPPMKEFMEEHKPYLDWEQLREWIDRGHEIGFHTHSHPFCSQISDELVKSEILEPVSMLKKRLNLESQPIPFAYPFGDRLPLDEEKSLIQSGLFSCLLDTAGLNYSKASSYELSRIDLEYRDIDSEVFGRPLLNLLRKKISFA